MLKKGTTISIGLKNGFLLNLKKKRPKGWPLSSSVNCRYLLIAGRTIIEEPLPRETNMIKEVSQSFKFQYFVILALLCYRVNECLSKFLVTDLGVFGILFFRSLFALAMLPLFMFYTKINYRCFFEKNVLIRNLFAAIALFLEVASLEYLSLSTLILLTYTKPIFTKVLARLFLGEDISMFDFFIISISIIGTLFIVDVSFEKEYVEGVVYALLGSLFFSLSLIVTKKVKTQDTNSLYFSYLIVLFFLSALKIPEYIPNFRDMSILFIMSLIHLAAFWLYLTGFLALKTSRAVVLEYLGLVFAIVLDYIFWGALLSTPQILGGTLIISSTLVSVYREHALSFFKKIYGLLRKHVAGSMSNSNE